MKVTKKKVAKTKRAAKTEATAPAAEKKTPIALDIKRERHDIEVGRLAPAPWNPRGKISPESVADLVASMATVGVIEPLVVMAAKDAEKLVYIIIAGHRRAAAAKLAGLATVPCDVLEGIDPAVARRMTFIENLQRRDADPILESNLVAELVADGMTTDEIAAEIGRDRKWVLRRKNLTKLSPSWRKRATREPITTDCLEHVAAYPREFQEKLKDADTFSHHVGDPLAWKHIRDAFARESLNLGDASFDTTKCLTCPNNSGCCPELFDFDPNHAADTKLGRCLDGKCWAQMLKAHIADIIGRAEAKGRTVVHSAPPTYHTTERPTKNTPILYVYMDCGHEVARYGEAPTETSDKLDALNAEAEAEAKAEKAAKRERNKAIRHLAQVCATDGNLARWLAAYLSGPDGVIQKFAPFVVHHLFRGIDSWMLAGSRTDIHDCAKALCFNSDAFKVPPEWTQAIVADIVQKLEPSRNEWAAHENARIICAMFADDLAALPDGLTPEEIASIYPATEHEGFERPAVKWAAPADRSDPGDEPDPDQKADDLVDAAIADAEG